MKIAVFVQARMGSSRLPGKVLARLGSRTVLEHVIHRVKSSGVGEVFVLTSIAASDLPILRFCSESGVRVACGSEDDVLDRFWQIARLLDHDAFVRITADCPILDPGVLKDTVNLHCSTRVDYTSNIAPPSFPDGLDCEVISRDALECAWRMATLPSQREHVTPFIRNNPDRFSSANLFCKQQLSHLRWTLDTPSDLEFLRKLVNGIGSDTFGMDEALVYLEQHPEIEEINAGQTRNEGYAMSLLKEADDENQ